MVTLRKDKKLARAEGAAIERACARRKLIENEREARGYLAGIPPGQLSKLGFLGALPPEMRTS